MEVTQCGDFVDMIEQGYAAVLWMSRPNELEIPERLFLCPWHSSEAVEMIPTRWVQSSRDWGIVDSRTSRWRHPRYRRPFVVVGRPCTMELCDRRFAGHPHMHKRWNHAFGPWVRLRQCKWGKGLAQEPNLEERRKLQVPSWMTDHKIVRTECVQWGGRYPNKHSTRNTERMPQPTE